MAPQLDSEGRAQGDGARADRSRSGYEVPRERYPIQVGIESVLLTIGSLLAHY